ncbi:hypothetical protein GCM10019814_20570 [Lactococcus raffinolactis]
MIEVSGKRSMTKPKNEPQTVPTVKIKKIVIFTYTKKGLKCLIK